MIKVNILGPKITEKIIFVHFIDYKDNEIRSHEDSGGRGRQDCPNRDSKIEIRCLNIFGFFEFQIEDNGIGIEKKHESRVFEIFQKLNNNQDSNGVGMSIVKKIIDNYGGKIWFESQVGQGTTFKFNLPRSMRSATLV